MRRVSAALLVSGLLAGCAPAADDSEPEFPSVGQAKIDVDTPRLRQIKKRAGIENCRPGTGRNDLPAVTLPCFGGGPDVSLNTLQGPLVVNLWAVTCEPCRHELPIYQEFSEKYAGKVPVVGIDYDDPATEDAMDLLRDTGVTYPQLADPQASLAAADPLPRMAFLPFLALVDADGEVVYRAAIAIKTLTQLEDLVEEHLGVTA
jgi:thiol-disulfide isomerase/thioredoxin